MTILDFFPISVLSCISYNIKKGFWKDFLTPKFLTQLLLYDMNNKNSIYLIYCIQKCISKSVFSKYGRNLASYCINEDVQNQV